MNIGDVFLWGFVGTALLTIILGAAQIIGISRMSIAYILGTIVTPDRGRALGIGFLMHLFNGFVFAFVYAAAFQSMRRADIWVGTVAGALHGLFVMMVLLPLLPGLHPRMASEHFGPTPTRMLQPPGFMGVHYGRLTPVVVLIAHIAFGIIMGAFYGLH